MEKYIEDNLNIIRHCINSANTYNNISVVNDKTIKELQFTRCKELLKPVIYT